jgi:hypothetical protein
LLLFLRESPEKCAADHHLHKARETMMTHKTYCERWNSRSSVILFVHVVQKQIRTLHFSLPFGCHGRVSGNYMALDFSHEYFAGTEVAARKLNDCNDDDQMKSDEKCT